MAECTKVRVNRISSITDPDTGQPGKQIELVEVKSRAQFGIYGKEDEARLIKSIISQFQSMGLFPAMPQLVSPKIILFLSETEYEMLGIRFEVNEIYDLYLKDGTITLKRSLEGV
jgi:hypothetical protein